MMRAQSIACSPLRAAFICLLLLASSWTLLAPSIDAPEPSDEQTIHAAARNTGAGLDPDLSWTNVSGQTGLWSYGGNYFSWGDYDADGDQDLLVNGARLLENSGAPNFTFTDVTGARGLPGGYGTGTWGDIDDDGDLDIFLGGGSVDAIVRNEGAPWHNFTIDAGRTQVISNSFPTTSGTLRDVNNDGWLDLYVANGENWNDGNPIYYRDFFYLGGANGFTNRSDMIRSDAFYTRGVSWGDADRDGWSDLYVGNYRIQPNRYYRNDNGTLDALSAVGANQENVLEGFPRTYNTQGPYWGHTIGSAFGDLNDDGYPEIVSANLVHLYYDSQDIRGRICDDSNFFTHDPVAGIEWYDFRPNSGIDYKPRGGAGTFQGDELYAGVTLGDVDNDGDLDMWLPQVYDLDYARAEMWINHGNLTFSNQATNWSLDVVNTYGSAFVDYDNDGDLDLITGGSDDPGKASGIHLYRNDGPTAGVPNHWLTVDVRDADGAPAIGANVELWRGGTSTQYREVAGGEGPHGSMSDARVHFGLAADSTNVDLLVSWPAGEILWLRNISADQQVTATQPMSLINPSDVTYSVNTSTSVEGDDVTFTIRTPSNWTVHIDVGMEGVVDWSDLSFSGQPLTRDVSLPFANQGTRTARLLAWDPATDEGRRFSSVHTVTGRQPVANITYAEDIVPGANTLFDATGTLDSAYDMARMEYRWEWDDGWNRDWSSNGTWTRSFPNPGWHNLTLSVRDEQGLTDMLLVPVEVAAKAPQISVAMNSEYEMDDVVSLTIDVVADASNAGGLTFRFDWGDGSVRDWNAEGSAAHVWNVPGPYTLNFSVRNQWEQQTDLAAQVNISNPPPTIVWTAMTEEATLGDEAVFQVQIDDTTSHRNKLSLEWTIDGSPLFPMPGATAFLRFTQAGNHTVAAEVSDEAGATARVETDVRVVNDAPANLEITVTDGILRGDDLWVGPDTQLHWMVSPPGDWQQLSFEGIGSGGTIDSDVGVFIDLWSESRQERLTYHVSIHRLEIPEAPQDATACAEWDPTPSNLPPDAELILLWQTEFGWASEEPPLATGIEPSELSLVVTSGSDSITLVGQTPSITLNSNPSNISEVEQLAGECALQLWFDDVEMADIAEAEHRTANASVGEHTLRWQVTDLAYHSVSGSIAITIEGEVDTGPTSSGVGAFEIPWIAIIAFLGLLLMGLIAVMFAPRPRRTSDRESMTSDSVPELPRTDSVANSPHGGTRSLFDQKVEIPPSDAAEPDADSSLSESPADGSEDQPGEQ